MGVPIEPQPCGPHSQRGNNLSNQMNPNCHLSDEGSKARRSGSTIKAIQPPHGQRDLELGYSPCMALVLPAYLSPSPSYPGAYPAMVGAQLELGMVAGAGQGW